MYTLRTFVSSTARPWIRTVDLRTTRSTPSTSRRGEELMANTGSNDGASWEAFTGALPLIQPGRPSPRSTRAKRPSSVSPTSLSTVPAGASEMGVAEFVGDGSIGVSPPVSTDRSGVSFQGTGSEISISSFSTA